MAILTPDAVRYERGLKICEKIIPDTAAWNRTITTGGYTYNKGSQYKANLKLSKGTGKVCGVTIHNTSRLASIAAGATQAEQYTRATWPNCNMGTVRVHYYVDEFGAWQNLREDEVGWHAADGTYGPGNNTTIALEIIMDGSGSEADKKAEANGALLCACLVDWYKLSPDNIYTHQHWYGKKYCPAYILPHWPEFVAEVKANIDRFHAEDAAQAPAEQPQTPAAETVPKADYDNLKACYDGLRGGVTELLNQYK